MNATEILSPSVFSGQSTGTTADPYLLEAAERAPLSVQVADTLAAVEALRPTWQEWTSNLNTDLNYYLHGLRNDSNVLHPYVITARRVGVPQAMLVARVKKERVSTVVSATNIQGPLATVLEVMAGSRMGEQSKAIDRLLARQLRDAHENAGVDFVCFQRLPIRSGLFRESQRLPGLLSVPHVFRYSVAPLTSSPGMRMRGLAGKNGREVRRKARNLERAFPGQMRFKCFSDFSEFDAGLRDACAVDASTWQRNLGYSALSSSAVRDRSLFCAQRGWLRTYVMYIGDAPVAYMIGNLYRETFYCQHAGFHPDFSRYSVGSLLTAWALENLAAAGVQEMDLGEGGQEHNRRLGCEVREEATVHLYAPTWRGLRIAAFFGATKAVRVVGRSARESLHWERVNRPWPRILSAKAASEHLEPEPDAEPASLTANSQTLVKA